MCIKKFRLVWHCMCIKKFRLVWHCMWIKKFRLVWHCICIKKFRLVWHCMCIKKFRLLWHCMCIKKFRLVWTNHFKSKRAVKTAAIDVINFLMVFPASFFIQIIQMRCIKQRVSGWIVILDFETIKNWLPEVKNLM